MKYVGRQALAYGYPMPLLMVATYNDDGTVNVMDLHEATQTVEGDLVLCIGEAKKTHANIEKRRAFTVSLVNPAQMAEADYFGTVSGHRVPDKFARTGLKAVKSKHVDAPIIEGSVLTIECELKEFVRTGYFSAVLGGIVDVAADESVLNGNRLDAKKTGMILYDSFSNSYLSLGETVGKAWGEGRKFM